MSAQWIWPEGMSSKSYIYYEQPRLMTEEELSQCVYGVAEFKKTVTLKGVPQYIRLKVSGDTAFRFWINGEFVGKGPVSAGGDFLPPEKTLDWYYLNPYTIYTDTDTLEIFAQVQLNPQVLTEFSYGQGGFWLEGIAHHADGTEETFGTDTTWPARRNTAWLSDTVYDETRPEEMWRPAIATGDARALSDPPVMMLDFETVFAQNARPLALHTGDSIRVEFDRIYSACIGLAVTGACEIDLDICETPGVGLSREHIRMKGRGEYRSIRMHSIGECTLNVIRADEGVSAMPCLYFEHYPADERGWFRCSDERLNRIFDVCRWTLKFCRQTIHLDGPAHQELLACTGDYYIETLMTLFSFGDLSLSKGDVLRTAQWLDQNDGRMFHTTYSLIWVQMAELVYRFTGDITLLQKCRTAMEKLLNRFETYIDESGVVANAPDYMFVDWMVADGYSLHHPPRYLGQSVLNAFYFGALNTAADISDLCGWEKGEAWRGQAAKLKAAFNRAFWDADRRLYFDGLGGETPTHHYLPANRDEKHFSRYPNILAALYGLCDEDEAKRLIRWAADDETDMPPIQPYFMCYLLLAVERLELTDELMPRLLLKWTDSVDICDKGLQEGWYKPEEGYRFDHSHAWAGCPAYFIPQMLLNLKMIEPGWRKIALQPKLQGLDFFDIAFPTPKGMLRVRMEKGKAAQIIAPDGVQIER